MPKEFDIFGDNPDNLVPQPTKATVISTIRNLAYLTVESVTLSQYDTANKYCEQMKQWIDICKQMDF